MSSQGHRGHRSNVAISRVLGPISAKLGVRMKLHPRIAFEGITSGKVKVIGVKGQISVFRDPWSYGGETV